jgi:putative PEP-CTERM system TPR-repeat lipoprotein
MLVGALAALLMSLAPPVFARGPDSAASYYENAVGRFHKQAYREALIQLKNALQRDPQHLPARVLLGETYLKLKDYPSAQRELRAAISAGADEAVVVPLLGQAYFLQRKYREALEAIPVSYSSDSAAAATWEVRGDAYLNLSRADEAERAYAEALRLRPSNSTLVLKRAGALVSLGRIGEAERLTERATSTEPLNPSGWYLKGDLQRFAGDAEGAIQDYTRVLELAPGHLGALSARAALFLDLGRTDEAVADLKELDRVYPRHPQGLYLRSLARTRAGDSSGARADLLEAAKVLSSLPADVVADDVGLTLLAGTIQFLLDHPEQAYVHLSRYVDRMPYHARAREMLGSALLRKKDASAAVAALEPALRTNPDDARLRGVLGEAYMKEARYSDAERVLGRAVELAPRDARLRGQLAASRLALRRYAEAKGDLTAALALSPEDAGIRVVIGHLQLAEGDATGALDTAGAVLRGAPQHAAGHRLRGKALLAAGDPMAARESLEQALRLEEQDVESRLALAAIALSQGDPGAELRYREILDRVPGEPRALLHLARVAETEGRRDDAINWLEQLRKAHPNAVDVLLDLPEIYLASGRPDAALSVAEDLNQRRPVHYPVLSVLARSQLAAGRRDEAARNLRVMYGLVLQHPADLVHVGRLQRLAGDGEGARQSLETALQAAPDLLPARAELVALAVDAGQLDEALKAADRLRASHPQLALGDVLAAEALMRQGRPAEAATRYVLALRNQPETELALQLYRAQLAAGDQAAALQGLAAWLEAHPDDVDGRRTLADGLLRAGDYPHALAQYERLSEATRDDVRVLNNLAWLYLRASDPRASSVAQRAVKLAPADPAALDTLGWILVQQGDTAEGLQYLREAHARASGQPEVSYHLAVALERLGRQEEARRHAREALRGGGAFDGAEEARALLDRLGGGR